MAADLTVLHVTDLHLYSDADAVNDGLVPAKSLAAVLAAAAAEVPQPGALVLTGDFTNDDTRQSYDLVRRLVRGAFPQTRVFFVPGNHEDLGHLDAAFSPDFVGPARPGQRLVSAPLLPGWQLVLLNTFLGGGAVHGGLDDATLQQLEALLGDGGDTHLLLALHHPPVEPAGPLPPWAGNCLVGGAAQLVALLEAHPRCRVALHGHLHADVVKTAGSCSIYCTPSTCTQTVVQSDTWQRDTGSQAGYRVLTLHPDGGHTTAVRRVDTAHCCAPP